MSYLDSLSKIEDLNNGTVVFYSPTVMGHSCMHEQSQLINLWSGDTSVYCRNLDSESKIYLLVVLKFIMKAKYSC